MQRFGTNNSFVFFSASAPLRKMILFGLEFFHTLVVPFPPGTVSARLTRFPGSGRLIPKFPGRPFREVVVPPYRFFYRCEDRIIWVVACWQGAQLREEPTQTEERRQ